MTTDPTCVYSYKILGNNVTQTTIQGTSVFTCSDLVFLVTILRFRFAKRLAFIAVFFSVVRGCFGADGWRGDVLDSLAGCSPDCFVAEVFLE